MDLDRAEERRDHSNYGTSFGKPPPPEVLAKLPMIGPNATDN